MSALEARTVLWGNVEHVVINADGRSGFFVDCPIDKVPEAIAALCAHLRERADRARSAADAAEKAAKTEAA